MRVRKILRQPPAEISSSCMFKFIRGELSVRFDQRLFVILQMYDKCSVMGVLPQIAFGKATYIFSGSPCVQYFRRAIVLKMRRGFFEWEKGDCFVGRPGNFTGQNDRTFVSQGRKMRRKAFEMLKAVGPGVTVVEKQNVHRCEKDI